MWESRWPIYLTFSVDEAGIHFACAPAERTSGFPGSKNNEEWYRALTTTNGSDPVTMPLSYFDLYYVPYQQRGNFISISAPANRPGYTGTLSPHRETEGIRIVVIYTALRDPGLKQGIIKKEPPLQLDLTVLDEAGRDDSGATRVLYNALLQAQNSCR